MKNNQTQYKKILAALRKAGKNGRTTFELMTEVGSTCIHKRVAEMGIWHWIGRHLYLIDKSLRRIGTRMVRVYRLVRWQA